MLKIKLFYDDGGEEEFFDVVKVEVEQDEPEIVDEDSEDADYS